jgi:hypothetical protein
MALGNPFGGLYLAEKYATFLMTPRSTFLPFIV